MDWRPIRTMPRDQYVLVARKSGNVTTEWDYLVAKFIPGYRDEPVDIDNNRLSDGGTEALFWAPLPEAPVEQGDKRLELTWEEIFTCELSIPGFETARRRLHHFLGQDDTPDSIKTFVATTRNDLRWTYFAVDYQGREHRIYGISVDPES